MNRFIISFGLVLAALALYFLFLGRDVIPKPAAVAPEKPTLQESQELTPKTETTPPSVMNVDRTMKPSTGGSLATPLDLIQKTPPMAKLIPKIEDIREQIKENPHETPEALLRFSIELSDKLQIALKSKEASEYFLKELRECAGGDGTQTSTAASASCIKNAYEVSAVYKELTPLADEVRGHASADTQKLYKNMQQLGL